jgi:hypothetical protein
VGWALKNFGMPRPTPLVSIQALNRQKLNRNALDQTEYIEINNIHLSWAAAQEQFNLATDER